MVSVPILLVLSFGATAYTQSTAGASATIFNLLADKTITAVSVDDKSVTHFTHHCTPRPADISEIVSQMLNPNATATPDVSTPSITTAPRPRIRRDAPDNAFDISGLCFDYQLLQGPSTWEMHLTDQASGLWTVDASCTFGNGGVLSASVSTCTLTNLGSLAGIDATTEVITHTKVNADISYGAEITPHAVVLETASGFTAPSPSKTTGGAPGVPLPTGQIIAMLGGAVGVFGLL